MTKFSVFTSVVIAVFVITIKPALSQNDGVQQTSPKTCIVTGETIEEGQGVELTYLGKTYNFCCSHCVDKFKKEPMNYIKEDIKCPVSGETASKDISAVYDGVKYYFCCENCEGKFKKDPEKYLNKDKKDNK